MMENSILRSFSWSIRKVERMTPAAIILLHASWQNQGRLLRNAHSKTLYTWRSLEWTRRGGIFILLVKSDELLKARSNLARLRRASYCSSSVFCPGTVYSRYIQFTSHCLDLTCLNASSLLPEEKLHVWFTDHNTKVKNGISSAWLVKGEKKIKRNNPQNPSAS